MPDDKVMRTLYCRLCGEPQHILLDPADVARWRFGLAQIQEALPYLNAGEREMLITQTCDTCWDRMNPEEDH